MRVLIDGDLIVYRSACAVQKTVYSLYSKEGHLVKDLPGLTMTKIQKLYPTSMEGLRSRVEAEPVSHALQIAKNMVNNIVKECENVSDCDTFTLYLTSTDKSNFRNKIAVTKPYKGNRVQEKPVHYDAVREYLISNFNAEVVSGMEADDKIGIEATKVGLDNVIIVSIDKDLDMIAGHHYNFVKKEMYYISEHRAIYNFYYQVLVGDTVDNIPGLKGVGPKIAKKILYLGDITFDDTCDIDPIWYADTLNQIVTNEYIIRGYTLEYLQEMKDLLWIRRTEDNE